MHYFELHYKLHYFSIAIYDEYSYNEMRESPI